MEKRIKFTKMDSVLQKDSTFKYNVTEEMVSIPLSILEGAIIDKEGESYLILPATKAGGWRVKENPLNFLEKEKA